jgi:hypothetical protein
MRQGLSWVEWTAVGLLLIAALLFSLSTQLGSLARPLDRAGWLPGPSVGAEFMAVLGSILCAAIGLSLFLVRPLLLLGPRAPVWLIPVIGLALFALQDRVCRAIYSEDLGALASRADCQIYAPGLGLILIFFGVVLTVRQFQVFRKRAG